MDQGIKFALKTNIPYLEVTALENNTMNYLKVLSEFIMDDKGIEISYRDINNRKNRKNKKKDKIVNSKLDRDCDVKECDCVII